MTNQEAIELPKSIGETRNSLSPTVVKIFIASFGISSASAVPAELDTVAKLQLDIAL